MGDAYLDEINLKLLNSFSNYCFSHRRENGWEVCIQM